MSRLWFVLLAVGTIPVASSHAQQLDPASFRAAMNPSESVGDQILATPRMRDTPSNSLLD